MRGGRPWAKTQWSIHSTRSVMHLPCACGSARVSRCCFPGHPGLAGRGPALTHRVAPAALPEPQGREGGARQSVLGRCLCSYPVHPS